MEDNTSALVPESQTITLKSGESIVVGRLDTEQTLDAIESIYSIIETLQSAGGEMTIPVLLMKNRVAVLELVGIAINKPAEFIKRLLPSESLALTAAVVAINRPFFEAEVLPMLGELVLSLGLVQPNS